MVRPSESSDPGNCVNAKHQIGVVRERYDLTAALTCTIVRNGVKSP